MPPPDQDTSREEIDLLARIGAGERDAFRALYNRYAPALFSLALQLLGDRRDSEEVLQDTFLKIWRHSATYDARKSRPFTWAVTILRRTAIDHLRRHRRTPPPAPLPELDDRSSALATAEDVRRTAEAGEDAVRLRTALAAVPAPQRAALELALFSTRTHAEIAAQLSQPVGTVKSWIRRGLLALRTTLNEPAR